MLPERPIPGQILTKICIFCEHAIETRQPRQWLGILTYAHRECYDAVTADSPRQDERRRFA